MPHSSEKTIPIIVPNSTKSYTSSTQITLSAKPASADYGPPSAVIHQPNNKICKNTKTYHANGTAAPSSTNEEYAKKQSSNLDCINYTPPDTNSSQERSSVQYYNGVPSSEGLRLRTAANKHDNVPKTERSASIEKTREMSPIIDGDRSAVSDLERTTSLKGITVFRGRVPGENASNCQSYTERANSKSISSTSTPNTRTSTSACATAVTDGHIIHYGDEHVESYL